MANTEKKQRLGQYSPAKDLYGVRAEQAANHVEAWPASNSPGPAGHTNRITSGRPAQRGPFATTEDNERAAELLKSFNPARNAKPDLMR